MRALLLAGLLVLILCGATCQRRPTAPVADVDPECRHSWVKSVDPLDTGVRWEGDPEDPAAWDALGRDVVKKLTEKLAGSERSRLACVGYIDDLHGRGITRPKE